jgi:hypothetical protein
VGDESFKDLGDRNHAAFVWDARYCGQAAAANFCGFSNGERRGHGF